VPKFSLFALLICLLPLKVNASQDNSTRFCERDCSMEYNFFKRYARQGSSVANLAMAIMNYQGHGRDKNVSLANRQLISASRAGEPAAMYQLAYNLMFGLYIKQDLEKSLIWFKRANKHGVSKSMKFITLLDSSLNNKNEKIQSSMKSILSENIKTEDIVVSVQKSQKPMERISVSQPFYWSFLLYNAKLQTCYINCTLGSSHTLIPTVRLVNEKVLLEDLNKLAKIN